MKVQRSLPQILRSFQAVGRAESVYEVASHDRINAIQEAILLLSRGDHMITGMGMRKNVGDGYCVLSSTARGGGVVSPATHFPWEISIETVDGSYYVRVRPGTINNFMPTNMFDTFGITQFGTYFMNLYVTTDGKQVTNASLQVDTSPPLPPATFKNLPPFEFLLLIGVVVDLKPFQIISGLITATPQLTVQTLTESPAPGRPYYDYNYTWKIEST